MRTTFPPPPQGQGSAGSAGKDSALGVLSAAPQPRNHPPQAQQREPKPPKRGRAALIFQDPMPRLPASAVASRGTQHKPQPHSHLPGLTRASVHPCVQVYTCGDVHRFSMCTGVVWYTCVCVCTMYVSPCVHMEHTVCLWIFQCIYSSDFNS